MRYESFVVFAFTLAFIWTTRSHDVVQRGTFVVENLSRTVRFKESELKLIEEFLERNPFFDFSSLTRIAVIGFIKQPSVQITPVGHKPVSRNSRSKNLTSEQ
jgi:hypothetical protein